jgi:hypothetical protein
LFPGSRDASDWPRPTPINRWQCGHRIGSLGHGSATDFSTINWQCGQKPRVMLVAASMVYPVIDP